MSQRSQVLKLRKWDKGTGPRITLGYTYFQDPEYLERQLLLWKEYPSYVDIFLVDDGSEEHTALDVIKEAGWDLPDYGPTFQLWKCTRNLGFNSHGCRNLIAKYALSDYVAFFDIDMQLSIETVGRLLVKKYSERNFYRHDLWVKHEQRCVPYPGHLNSFLIHKDLFWEAGGYDESFTGHHWGDREFLERLFTLEHRKVNSALCVTLDRKGRHGKIVDTVQKTEYEPNEDLSFLAPMDLSLIHI